MADHGRFSGNPSTEWVSNSAGPDRDMTLLKDFVFTDPDGRVWPAPKGSVINGASIPRPLWSLVGSPYTDDYRRASIVHDVTCITGGVSRKDADVMFFHACRAGGCGPVQARILYAGVRIGAWALKSLSKEAISPEALLYRFEQDLPPEVGFMQSKLGEIAREMEGLSEEPTIAQLDSAIKRHLRV